MFKGAKLIVTVAVGIVAVIGLLTVVTGREKTLEIIFGPMDLTAVDFASLQLGGKSNQFLVCPDGY